MPAWALCSTVIARCESDAPMLKFLIIAVMLLMVVSLFSGLVFLFKDSNVVGSKRTLYALGIRVSLAVTLLVLIGYGLYTGELGVNAPWHNPHGRP